MICIPICSCSHKEALRDIERSCLITDAIELRMDLISDGKLPELISTVRSISDTVKVIVTCRRKEEAAPAGRYPNMPAVMRYSKTKKAAIFRQAVELGADYIDIELAEGALFIDDLASYCRRRIHPVQIIISYHNFKLTPAPARLREIFHQCREFKPAVVKIVTYARKPDDNLKVLGLIPYAREYSQEIIALCMGDVGRISRVAAPFLGNFLNFATLEAKAQSAPGQLTVAAMRKIDQLVNEGEARSDQPVISSPDGGLINYVLLGNPVRQSLSPLMHNAALAAIGIEGTYNAFCVNDLAAAIQGIRGMNIRGASVTVPFKSAVMKYLDDIDSDALKIGAVNTICNDNGRLTGFNTDWLGLLFTLRKCLRLEGKKFVILGAGGTARAAAYGIMKDGALPIIVNRTAENGRLLARKLDCPFYPLSELKAIEADGLINTTPVGMHPRVDESPVAASLLAAYKYVVDVVYNPLKTKMLQDAERQGCIVFTGLEMFVHQGAEQIRLWTGKEPMRELMQKMVEDRLSKDE